MPLPRNVPVEHLRIPRIATWKRRRRAMLDTLEKNAPCIYLPNHDFHHSCISPALSSRIGIIGIAHSDDPQHYGHVERLGSTWNATVAVSKKIAGRLIESGFVDRTRLSSIPYGVDCAQKPSTRTPGDKIRIIYTGRLDALQKRVGDLIAVGILLRDRGVPFTMSIVGAGPERDWLRQAIDHNEMAQHIQLFDTVDNATAVSMCTGCDVFMLPSAYEGMPIGVLEAMGQGCVPLVSDIESGIPELITNGVNGFKVPTGDVAAFADRVAGLYADSAALARMSHEARLTISRNGYSAGEMIDRYIALIDRVSSEITSGRYRRPGDGRIADFPTSSRDRVLAPFWLLRPSLREQQGVSA